jgi:hypothetical protein
MLEFFFDDSGAHDGSNVAVWGGIVGHSQFIEQLKNSWGKLLAEPIRGKPAISHFRSYDLSRGIRQFEGYKEAERDEARYNFRQAIIDAGVSVVANGVSVPDYNEIVTGKIREALGSAERFILGKAVQSGCRAVAPQPEPLALHFDKGALTRPDLKSVITLAVEAAKLKGDDVRCCYSDVKETMPLQAADLVAHETYRYFCQFLKNRSAQPDAHYKALFHNSYDFHAGLFSRDELVLGFDRVAASISDLGH